MLGTYQKRLEKIFRNAVVEGNCETAKKLAEYGDLLESTNLMNRTPIQIAASYGHFSVVQFLHVSGANLFHRDYDDRTALHFAARNGCSEVVQYLLSVGCDPNTADKEGLTPLHWAVMFLHEKAVQLLIKFGAQTLSPLETAKALLAEQEQWWKPTEITQQLKNIVYFLETAYEQPYPESIIH